MYQELLPGRGETTTGKQRINNYPFFFLYLNRVLSEIPSGNYSLNEMLQLKVHFEQEKCSSYQLGLWPGWKLSGDQSHPLETLQTAFSPE